MLIYPELYPADIGAVVGKGPLLWCSQNLLEPKTDRIHHLLIGDYLPWDDDYVILESIGKGIAVGRLSFYQPDDLEIYRVVLDNEGSPEDLDLRSRVAAELTRVGRARYDWMLYIQLGAGALSLICRGEMPPYDPAQLPYGRNRAYICTEAANFGWRYHDHPIISKGVVPTPAGFKMALLEGRIRKVFPDEED